MITNSQSCDFFSNLYRTDEALFYPIVREMFIDNLAHASVLSVQQFRREVEDDVEHGGLRCQSSAAMFRKRIRCYLVVNIVGAQTTDDDADKLLIYRNATKRQ